MMEAVGGAVDMQVMLKGRAGDALDGRGITQGFRFARHSKFF